MKEYQLELQLAPPMERKELLNRCALRDDLCMLLQTPYDEWDRLNRIEELATIYKIPEQGIKDYVVLYRYLRDKDERTERNKYR